MKRFALGLFFCGSVTAIDIWSTARNEFWIIGFEGNPIQRAIMECCGIGWSMAFRCFSTVFAIVLLTLLRRHRARLAIVLLVVWIISQTMCAFSLWDGPSIYYYIQMRSVDILGTEWTHWLRQSNVL